MLYSDDTQMQNNKMINVIFKVIHELGVHWILKVLGV